MGITILGKLQISFLDSIRYFSGILYSIGQRFNLPAKKGKYTFKALEQKQYSLKDIPFREVKHLYENKLETTISPFRSVCGSA